MSYVNSDSAQAAAASVTVTAPVGIQDGDILVALVSAYRSTSAAPSAITLAGFTWTARTTATYYLNSIGWKRASGESGNYTFTSTNATQMAATVLVLRGRLAVGTPVQVSNTAYLTSNTTVRAAALTAAAGDDLCWGGWYFDNVSTPTLTTPTNFTNAGYQQVSTIFANRLAFRENVAAGSTSTIDGTCRAASIVKHAFMFSVYADRPGHRLQRAGSQVW